MAPTESLAAALVTGRQQRGLTQADLARRLGVTPETVCRWERGWNRPRPRRLPSLVRALSIPLTVPPRQPPAARNRRLSPERVAVITRALRGVVDELRRA